MGGLNGSREKRKTQTAELPPLPRGYTRSYAYVFDPQGEVVISKWWATASCKDAFAREEQKKLDRLAAIKPPQRKTNNYPKQRCMTGRGGDLGRETMCRAFAEDGRRYCKACSKSRNRRQTSLAVRKTRASVRKTGFSPVGAEALKSAYSESGYGGSRMHLAEAVA